MPGAHPNHGDTLTSTVARDEYLGTFEATGVSITGFNGNGQPLHPNPLIGDSHAENIRCFIRLLDHMGQDRTVILSGLPGWAPCHRIEPDHQRLELRITGCL